MLMICCNVAGSVGFEDVPLPLFLKFVERAEPFWSILGLFIAELHFNLIFLDSDDSAGA